VRKRVQEGAGKAAEARFVVRWGRGPAVPKVFGRRCANLNIRNGAGILARNAAGLNLHQVDIRWDGEMPDYYRSGLRFENTNNVVVDGFVGTGPGRGQEDAVISLAGVDGITIRNCRAGEGTTTFLKHENVRNAGLFTGNDLVRAVTPMTSLPSPFAAGGQ
jgi:hypothetical protein